MRYLKLVVLTLSIMIYSCSSSTVSLEEILEITGKKELPTQLEYPDDGAVILYESSYTKLFLDSDWDVNLEESFTRSIIYFNDKAESWVTPIIYLDDDRVLTEFYARTIKPNGQVIELSDKDLFPTTVESDLAEFSNNRSMKFTFPAIEEGVVLEYSYKVMNIGSFLTGDTWYVQNSIPKLYTKYALEIPSVFRRYNIDWDFQPVNLELGNPKIQDNLLTQSSSKNESKVYYWEVRNIPALKSETNMPPYKDAAKYVSINLEYNNWNDLSKRYWNIIKERFSLSDLAPYKKLAEEIVTPQDTEESIIRKIFYYVQQNYRYVSIDINDSNIKPNSVDQIIKNKYGDCKDMTVLSVLLLKSLGIEAYPALVRTKSNSYLDHNIISLDFNHMISYVKTSGGKEYWLDATGSSCPLGCVYSSIEGTQALVIFEDGKSRLLRIPKSKSYHNQVIRSVAYSIKESGNIEGHAKLHFKGNDNLSIRSSLRIASEDDMNKILNKYINEHTPGLDIQNLTYDNPAQILDEFFIEFDFNRAKAGSINGDLLLIKPNIFNLKSRLDSYPDIARAFPVKFFAPYQVIDSVTISFDNSLYKLKSDMSSIIENNSCGKFTVFTQPQNNNSLKYTRKLILNDVNIPCNKYSELRNIHKTIAESNEELIILTIN